jgi:N-acetylmuramoyl-L-alanine amidase
MRIMEFLSKLHRYYLKLSGKKKLLVFVVVFILGFILGSAFSNYKNASEMKKEAYQGNEYENNQAEKKHEDKELEELPQEPSDKEVIVVIDPGHGGEDFGTYYGNILEKDLNLDISLKMGSIIEEAGIKVVYTRTEDKDVGLDERAFMANNLDATLFISVHNNSMPDNPSYKGTETLFCPSQNPVYGNMDGKKLASIVQSNLINKLNTIDNGIIERPNLVVLRKTKMPAVIAEIAYLSNASDRELLKQAEFRQKAAQALVDSVFEALEVMEAEKDEDGVWKIKK